MNLENDKKCIENESIWGKRRKLEKTSRSILKKTALWMTTTTTTTTLRVHVTITALNHICCIIDDRGEGGWNWGGGRGVREAGWWRRRRRSLKENGLIVSPSTTIEYSDHRGLKRDNRLINILSSLFLFLLHFLFLFLRIVDDAFHRVLVDDVEAVFEMRFPDLLLGG